MRDHKGWWINLLMGIIGPRWVFLYPDYFLKLHYRAHRRFIGPGGWFDILIKKCKSMISLAASVFYRFLNSFVNEFKYNTTMPEFIPGLQLSELYYQEAVKPILRSCATISGSVAGTHLEGARSIPIQSL